MREITHIVLHTAGSSVGGPDGPVAVHQTFDIVKGYHINHNGWSDIGYHYYVEKGGQFVTGRSQATQGAHVRGFNATTIGICVSGHGDVETWNDVQRKRIIDLCTTLCRQFKLSSEAILGHRECSELSGHTIDKTCPGSKVNMDQIRAIVKDCLKQYASRTPYQTLEQRVNSLEEDPSSKGYKKLHNQIKNLNARMQIIESDKWPTISTTATVESRLKVLEQFMEQFKAKTVQCEPDKGTTLFEPLSEWDRNR